MDSPNTVEIGVADRVANRIGSRWSAVDTDDLRSHLYLWLVQNRVTLERWRSENLGEGKLYVSLRREAARFCARETAARVGRPISAGNFYTADLVARALPYVFEDTPQTTVPVNPVTGEPAPVSSEFDTAVALLADVRGAFYGLNRDLQETLGWRFRDGLTFEEIGELRGVTKDGAKKAVDRAVQRLADSLAGERL